MKSREDKEPVFIHCTAGLGRTGQLQFTASIKNAYELYQYGVEKRFALREEDWKLVLPPLPPVEVEDKQENSSQSFIIKQLGADKSLDLAHGAEQLPDQEKHLVKNAEKEDAPVSEKQEENAAAYSFLDGEDQDAVLARFV